ncbi:MAG: metallophosphoesterase family protein, partial [Solirubrobacteraceae bacterium]
IKVHLARSSEPIMLADGALAVLPAPLLRRHEATDITAAWDGVETPPGAFRVGLAHGSVAGILPKGADAVNPIAADRAARARLDYLALGDWHGTLEAGPSTWYCGTPEADSFKANDRGNVLRVEIEAGEARVQRSSIGHYQWTELEAELQSRGDIDGLDSRLAKLGESSRQVARLDLRGTLTGADRDHLETRLEWWKGQFAALEAETEHVRMALSEQDFAQLQPPGFVADVVATLRARAEAGDPVARNGLEIVYRELAGLGSP